MPKATSVLICSLLLAWTATELLAQESSAKREDAAQAEQRNSSIAQLHDADSSLRIGPGDLLEVSVYNVPELTTKARIGNSGDVYLPLIRYAHLAGRTTEEAERVIEKQLADGGFVKNPHVTVFVEQSASQGASILGEITRPGIYPVVGEQRLFDLISAAGGLTEKAGRSITLTHRSQPETPITIPVSHNLEDSPGSNVPVFPGDTIIVRKADVVYVVGDVGRPSGLLMESGRLTVLQAIALAGGTTRTAKLSAARIIRKGPSGISETPVALKKILEAKAPDLPMQADDILFVPTSAGKAFAGHT
ncbi:MAG TPA: polysaccharide biosynthesis/export family protein, partial [Terriglobales bacterium]|nr:polysaccharide biosynthesis/export family protein [Terriglobales bacterium]